LLERAPSNVRLVAVSAHTRRDVLTFFPQWRGRVTVVPAPPPLPTNQPVATAAQPYVLAVATLEARKNIGGVLAGWEQFHRRHPDFTLKLVGTAGYLAGPERRHLARLVAAGTVELLGYVSDVTRSQLYADAFCLVYPSFEEGYGYPPLEAFAAARPVVASSAGALPEVLGDAALYVDPYGAGEELAAALTALANDPVSYRQYQQRGVQRLAALRAAFDVQPLVDLWRTCASA
jgi:alpha-1,3-rhamnosyl/mannosyltransferase